MKTYLVTVYGRKNTSAFKIRDKELFDVFVDAHNMKEAKELVWNKVEANITDSLPYGLSRRDYRIEAEIWGKDAPTYIPKAFFSELSHLQLKNGKAVFVYDLRTDEEKAQDDLEKAKKELQTNLSATLKLRAEKRAEWKAEAESNPSSDKQVMVKRNTAEANTAIKENKYIYLSDVESMLELCIMCHIEECYDEATDSIIIPDSYFDCVDVFVLDLLRNRADLSMMCKEDETHQKFWHINRASEKASEASSVASDKITQENTENSTEIKSEPQKGFSYGDIVTEKDDVTEWGRVVLVDGDILFVAMYNNVEMLNYYYEEEIEKASPVVERKARANESMMTMKQLSERRADLCKKQQKEYKKRGNTQFCQILWKEIESVDEEIAKRYMRGESL